MGKSTDKNKRLSKNVMHITQYVYATLENSIQLNTVQARISADFVDSSRLEKETPVSSILHFF